MKAVGVVILVILALIISPWLLIWALNTLVPTLAIPFTFSTWLAALLVGGILRGAK